MGFESPREPSLTIVGGQPTRGARTSAASIPRGIEQLLSKAASEESFARQLVEARREAIADAGLELTEQEEATLAVVSDHALETMIRAFAAARERS